MYSPALERDINRMMRLILSGLFILAVAGTAVLAEDWEHRLIEELNAIQDAGHHRLSYVQTLTGKEGVEVARYDATQRETWQLLQVDGVPPTDRQQQDFQKQQQRERKRRQGERLSDLIARGSVQAQGLDEQGRQLLHFSPHLEDMPDSDALQGTALWSQENQHLVMLRVFSKTAFSPRFPVTVNQLEMVFHYQQIQGETVPERYTVLVVGKLAGIKTFKVSSTAEYSNIQLLISAP